MVGMDYEKFYNNHNCLLCQYFCINRRSLGNHLNRTHNISTNEYILKFMFDDKIPLCKCGCNTEVNWHKSKYKYNDYISGHNDSGFDIGEFKPTKEQIEKRNDSIRETYKDRGEEISKKISDSVNLAWEDPVKVENNSKGKKELWKDPDYHKKMTAKRKQVWDEQGDELRKKIFTPEFGRKIAIANMNRDYKRKSQAEIDFISHLKNVGIDVHEDKWFNVNNMTKCYDGYLYDQRLLIEFDGVYWHGLDRIKNFTYDQVNGIVNDFIKNRLAKEEGWALIRIRSDIDYADIKSYEDLISKAYHYQDKEGNIIKDGRLQLDDKTPLLSKEDLVRLHIKNGKEYIETNYLELVISFLKEHVLSFGWFYPEKDQSLNDAVSDIVSGASFDEAQTVFSSTSNEATTYLKSEFKSFWNVTDGPSDSFWNDKALKNVVKYRLGINNSKPYKYKIDDEDVFCNETFDINFANIRRGFVVQRKTVSFFKPKTAFEIYYKFLNKKKDVVVWDPSCGFGARLLGFYSFCNSNKINGRYIGNEPADQTYNDLLSLKSKIENSNFHCDLLKYGSEESLPIQDGIVDLAFTSPPYFDKEKYFKEESQCWKKYSNIKLWEMQYLIPTIQNAFRILKPERKLIININKDLADLVNKCALQVGFQLDEEMKLSIGRDHFSKKKGDTEKAYEPILVFKKG
jgi:hypothetical protein